MTQIEDLQAYQARKVEWLNSMPQAQPTMGDHLSGIGSYHMGWKAFKWLAIFNAFVGAKAGLNHYRQNGDVRLSVWYGFLAFLRWMSWSLTWIAWAGLLWWSLTPGAYGLTAQDIWTALALVAISPFVLGVTWCRFIDFSLFRRGFFYSIFTNLAKPLDAVPTLLFFLPVPALLWTAVKSVATAWGV